MRREHLAIKIIQQRYRPKQRNDEPSQRHTAGHVAVSAVAVAWHAVLLRDSIPIGS